MAPTSPLAWRRPRALVAAPRRLFNFPSVGRVKPGFGRILTFAYFAYFLIVLPLLPGSGSWLTWPA